MGGTCVIRGCVPKKLLVYASHVAEELEDAAGYGWSVGESTFSWPDLIRAKDKEIDRLNSVYLNLLANAGVTLYEKRGVMKDRHTISLGDETVTAEKILVAVGGRPWVPDIPGIEHAITSDEAFHLPELPRRVAVVGGGFIACEFAGIFKGLGAKVTQIYRGDAVLRGFDHDVRRVVTGGQQRKGIEMLLETNVTEIEKTGDGLRLSLDNGETLNVDEVMYATGRVPNALPAGPGRAALQRREVDLCGDRITDEQQFLDLRFRRA